MGSCELSAAPMKAAASGCRATKNLTETRLPARYLYQQEELQTWKQLASRKRPRSSPPATTRLRGKVWRAWTDAEAF